VLGNRQIVTLWLGVVKVGDIPVIANARFFALFGFAQDRLLRSLRMMMPE